MNCSIEGMNLFKRCFEIGVGIALSPVITYAHEFGHVGAVKLFYVNANTKMKVGGYGYWGGEYSFNDSKLSNLGNLIGPYKSKAITSAAGCIAQKSTTLAISLLFPSLTNSLVVSDLHIIFHVILIIGRKALYTGKQEDIKDSDKWNDFMTFRMNAGLLPTLVLITSLIAASTFSLLQNGYQSGGDVLLFRRCLQV